MTSKGSGIGMAFTGEMNVEAVKAEAEAEVPSCTGKIGGVTNAVAVGTDVAGVPYIGKIVVLASTVGALGFGV